MVLKMNSIEKTDNGLHLVKCCECVKLQPGGFCPILFIHVSDEEKEAGHGCTWGTK